ncbi:MAG TPA: hypothetical protein VLB83_01820, partial [Candidatus Paceibacterota bacterium]|nr:hypothetical protein [Candidatus Paceibacterota bacterium]
VDASYIYVAGVDVVPGNNQWRIQKLDITTGAAVTAFDSDGTVMSNPSTSPDEPFAMVLTATDLYIGGYDNVVGAGNDQFRIEKRDISTGALVAGFGASGVVQENLSTSDERIHAARHDGTYLYVAGLTQSGIPHAQKRLLSDGSLVAAWNGDGRLSIGNSTSDQFRGIAVNGTHVFLAGGVEDIWLMEKRDITTGLRVTSSFGANTCANIRDLNTSTSSSAWYALQTEDETANRGTGSTSDYYAFDFDNDGTIEEAAAFNIPFAVTLPPNAIPTSVFYVSVLGGSAGGTKTLSLRDYSGISVSGGWVNSSAAVTSGNAFDDPVTANVSNVNDGLAGYYDNPKRLIDTVNNLMNFRVRSSASGASTTNSVYETDFIMASLSWVETVVPSIQQLHYRWRRDDGSETFATYPTAEDAPLTAGVYRGDRIRLRTLLSNTGAGWAASIPYRLEYASSSCSAWVPVPATESTLEWVMDPSPYVSDGAVTTDSSGLTNPAGKTFRAGVVKESGNSTSAHTLTQSQFTELEYAIRSTLAVQGGETYCFRVTNAGTTTNITYGVQPQIIISNSQRPAGGGSGTEAPGSGPQQGGGQAGGGSGTENPSSGSGQGGGGAGGGGGSE